MIRPADNPFRSEKIDSLSYRPQGTSWTAILHRLSCLDNRGAIVGPHGSGKTTLLNDLGRRFADQGYQVRRLFMNGDSLRPSFADLLESCRDCGEETLVLFDGAGHLPWPLWQLFKLMSHRSGGVIITGHRPGRMPTLLETSTTPGLLDALVADLLQKPPAELRQQLPALHRKHNGNIREVLFELYRLAPTTGCLDFS